MDSSCVQRREREKSGLHMSFVRFLCCMSPRFTPTKRKLVVPKIHPKPRHEKRRKSSSPLPSSPPRAPRTTEFMEHKITIIESESDFQGALQRNATRLDTPTKSPNDKRDYRVIKLENGLTALLIADHNDSKEEEEEDEQEKGDTSSSSETENDNDEDCTESDEDDEDDVREIDSDDDKKMSSTAERNAKSKNKKMAAAALCVGVGSFSDPDDIPGLAHFLEHMVFMGSKKYPKENAFDAFIQRHGGSDNASTDCEHTIFQFDVHKKHFHESLDRFVQFFTAPLMKKDGMHRELEAVDSEFQLSVPSDTHRIEQLLCSFAAQGNPLGKFMWGSTKTLKTTPEEQNIDVHSRLFEFWKRYYSAHYMTLVVQSQESLDTLEEWVTDIFSEIPNNNLPPPSFVHLRDPFNTEAFRKLYKVVPVKNSHQLRISWSLPSLTEHYRAKPLQYLWYLVAHKAHGSILAYLKEKVWALDLWVEDSQADVEFNSFHSLFGIGIELTDQGLDHLYEVASCVFAYIAMLQKVGPQEWIFKEMQSIAETAFQWEEEMASVEYVEILSHNMRLYPPKDYLTGDELHFEYDPKLIEECLMELKPEKANLIVMSKQFEKERICDKVEKWYQTPYQENEIDSKWLEEWKNLPTYTELHLPQPNPYIATDFLLCTLDAPSSEHPIKILDDSQSRLWYKKDNKFLVPKAFMYFHLMTSIGTTSPESAALMDLMVHVLAQNMKEDVYASELAMLSYGLSIMPTGLILSISGFNQKLKVLLATILDHLVEFQVTDQLFEAMKLELAKMYHNRALRPGKLCWDVRLAIMQQVYWMEVEKKAVVTHIDKGTLLDFVKRFKANLFIEGLIQGNMTSKEALQCDQIVRSKLQCGPPLLTPEVRVVALESGVVNVCRVASLNEEDGNSVIINYYQSEPGSIKSSCIGELALALMEEPCFDQLRTRKQLGYDVSCELRNTYGVLGFSIDVHTQESKFSCSEVDETIEEFLDNFQPLLKGMSDNEFQAQVTSLIQAKQCADLHLKQEVDRNLSEIVSRYYVFDRLDKEVECLRHLTRRDVEDWIHRHSKHGSNFKKLSVQVVGGKKKKRSSKKGTSVKPEAELHFLREENDNRKEKRVFITDIPAFKQQHAIYPAVKITE